MTFQEAISHPMFHHVGFRQMAPASAVRGIVYLRDETSPTGVMAADAPHLLEAEAYEIMAKMGHSVPSSFGASFSTK